MKIGFVGAGKVGRSLGLYFKSLGLEVMGYYSRTRLSAENAANLTQTEVFETLDNLLNACSMIWITTNDDAIATVVEEIEELELNATKTFVHTSGLLNSELFDSLNIKGHNICSAHPLLAFSSEEIALQILPKCYFFIEGDEGGVKFVSALFNKIGIKFVNIDRTDKIAYHTGAVIVSNYLVTLSHLANQSFALAKIDDEDLRAAVNVLLKSALENLATQNPKDALTGPIKRADAQTVASHLTVLDKHLPDVAQFYRIMAIETMKMIDDFRLKETIENE